MRSTRRCSIGALSYPGDGDLVGFGGHAHAVVRVPNLHDVRVRRAPSTAPVAVPAYGCLMIAARYVPDVPAKHRTSKTKAAREHAEAHPEGAPDKRTTRVCATCDARLERVQIRSAAGWEPTRDGWRCGTCGTRRRQLVSESARKLIANADCPWKLALLMPAHARYDLCLPCEVLAAAGNMLLCRGGLGAGEETAMRAELRRRLPTKRCGHDQQEVLMAIDPDHAPLQVWCPTGAR